MLLQVVGNTISMEPGPFDVHTHPRALDAITEDNFEVLNNGFEGKAGLGEYTAVALRSGFTGMAMMPNEAYRFLDQESGLTVVKQFPLATHDRLIPVQAMIAHEAHIPTASIFGLDPETAILKAGEEERVNRDYLSKVFNEIKDNCVALKIYGAVTTGGNNVGTQFIAEIVSLWNEVSPEKPIIMHLEDEDVANVLKEVAKLPNGKDIPLHIAHVSSRQELEAVIFAKQSHMNVTCEVTPHHLSLTEDIAAPIGSYGCMKPKLKTQEDIDYIWENIEWVDIFASDCAPHRLSDKENEEAVTYGVVNHNVMIPVLLAAVEAGRLTHEQLYQKLCINPRVRFNLPLEDNSYVVFDAEPTNIERLQERAQVRYQANPWEKLNGAQRMTGNLIQVVAGKSELQLRGESLVGKLAVSYSHLILPRPDHAPSLE